MIGGNFRVRVERDDDVAARWKIFGTRRFHLSVPRGVFRTDAWSVRIGDHVWFVCRTPR